MTKLLSSAGAATEAAITGSLNPADWGQQVKQQVAPCKAELTTGQHGIGECVSTFAKQHGDLVSDQHPANGNAKGTGKANGKHTGQGQGNGHTQPVHKRDTTTPGMGLTVTDG